MKVKLQRSRGTFVSQYSKRNLCPPKAEATGSNPVGCAKVDATQDKTANTGGQSNF